MNTTQTYYYRHANGGFSAVEVSEGVTPEVPDGATQISRTEYEAGLAQVQEQVDAHLAALREAERQSARADYEALIAAGIPEVTARRLAGYEPEEPDEPGGPGDGGGTDDPDGVRTTATAAEASTGTTSTRRKRSAR